MELEQDQFNDAAEEHYHRLADYMEKLEDAGYVGIARMGQELLGRLTGRPLRMLMCDAVQALAFSHGINGTGLQYAQVAGFRYRELDDMEMTTSLSFQNLESFLIADDYDPGLNVAVSVVHAVCDAALEVGPPGELREGEMLGMPDVVVQGAPVTKEGMGKAFEAALKTHFGPDFDLETLLEGVVP